ncbi:MAG TPA: DUF5715 family protein [Clostridia bacterium]|nr:DUF5715 family protein [Clostridia bacterium]
MLSRRIAYFLIVVMLMLSAATTVSAATRRTRTRRVHRGRHVRRVVWNPMFRGSHELLVRQNEEIDRLELPRIADDDELLGLIGSEQLVPLSESQALIIASNLTETRRYCRSWLRDFLQDFSEAYYEEFKRPIQVNSLVRTAEQQKKLRRHNRNAAPQEGETASTHMTGMTVDISKRGLTRKQHKWIEQYFLPLKEIGLIDPIEERRQPVFHVTVFGRYADYREAEREPEERSPETRQGSSE